LLIGTVKEGKAGSKRRSSEKGKSDDDDESNPFVALSKYCCESLYFFQCFGDCATESMIRGTKKQDDEIVDYRYLGATSHPLANADISNKEYRNESSEHHVY
jgi:hypothetical protein